MNSNSSKIFCIGLSKTGTTSLATALQALGFRTKDNLGVTHYTQGDLHSSVDLKIIDQFDAFTDTPIPSFYRELDSIYPSSKFILTVRDLGAWLNSCKKQFNQRATEKRTDAINRLFKDIYDTPYFVEEKFTKGYQRFVDDVLEYFKDRPNDLLVIDISAGEGWEKLCPFLNKEIPDRPFPKSNVTEIQWIDRDELIAIAENAGEKLLKAQQKFIKYQAENEHKSLTNWIRSLLRVEKTSLLNKAINVSHQSILKDLQKLTPNIPVFSKIDHDIPFSKRKSWNHVWLVDPLNGTDQFTHKNSDYCLSISLIQDGQPVYGVIHNPRTRTTFYAKRGKGCYMKNKDRQLFKLERQDADNEGQTATIINRNRRAMDEVENYLQTAFPTVNKIISSNSSCIPLDLCQFVLGRTEVILVLDATEEWETAPAHAVLKELGKNIYDLESQTEIRYNTKNMIHASILTR